ncbi:MAG: hypothetical protein MJ204_08550 [Bacteroidales bacterium]|nr:hypothetical protein [Bacteroidales bacterium]
MKTVLKYIGITLAAVVFVFLIASVTIPYMYKDEIVVFATEKLGKQVKADISVSDVTLTLFGDFPNISIQLNNVAILSTKTFNEKEFANYAHDTAVYAQRILLSFNALDFLFKNYVIKQIIVHDSFINFFLDSNGKHNCEISMESDTTGSDMFLELSKIRFRNAQLLYHDRKSNIEANEWFDKIHFSGKFQGDDFNVDIFSTFTNKKFLYQGTDYFAKSAFRCDLAIMRDNASYIVKKTTIETPVGTIISDGIVKTDKNNDFDVDLHVNVETSVKKILKVLPQNITDSLAEYKPAADIFVEGNLKGKIGSKSMPSIVCNIACTKGEARLQNTTYNFYTKGELQAKDIAQLHTYNYSTTNTKITTGKSTISASKLTVKNFEKPQFSLEGTINGNIEDIDYLADIDDYKTSGTVAGTFSCAGSTDVFSDFTPNFFKQIQLQADVHCQNLAIQAPKDSPYNFSSVNGHLVVNKEKLSVDSVNGTLQGTPFSLQGTATDFFSYILFDNVDTRCNLTASIDNIDLLPFYNHYESLAESTGTGMLMGDIACNAKHLDFDPYHLDNAHTIIRLKPDGIDLLQIEASTLRGKLSGTNVSFTNLPNKQTKCVASGTIAKMEAKDIFTTFNNFDQDYITDKQIDGTLSGTFRFSSIMDENYDPVLPTMDVMADITIENGSAKNVGTLMEIGKKLKMKEEFANVTFSTLKNTIRIQQDTLFIPDMKIQSNAFEMSFAGKHNIESNSFAYYVTVFLKKTLSLKFNSKNKEEEDFGEIEKNTDGNFRIPLKIFGNPDKFNIDYDFGKTKKNVKKEMDEQKSEWKEIINAGKSEEDIKAEEEKKKPIESGFQIEY